MPPCPGGGHSSLCSHLCPCLAPAIERDWGTRLPTLLLSPRAGEWGLASPPQWLSPSVVTGMCGSGAVSKVTLDELGLRISPCPRIPLSPCIPQSPAPRSLPLSAAGGLGPSRDGDGEGTGRREEG